MAELARFQVVDVGHITDLAPVNKLFHDALAQERAIQVCDSRSIKQRCLVTRLRRVWHI